MSLYPRVPIPPFSWTPGAIWLKPDGGIEQIPGFHEEWIRSHQDQVAGCVNVSDVVQRMGWISVVTYANRYVELMIPSRRDSGAVEAAVRYLALNLDRWDNALVLGMDEDLIVKLHSSEMKSIEDAVRSIQTPRP